MILFISSSICLLWMVTFVLVNVAMHQLSHICATKINALDVICGNTLDLVASFGSVVSWRLLSCIHFNNISFGSLT